MTIDKDDPHLKPAPCGHIHYLRRAALRIMGIDLATANEDELKLEANGALNLSDVWPLDREFSKGIYDDAEAVIDAHQEHEKFIERLDEHTRAVILMRLAERTQHSDDRQLYDLVRLLALDALLTDINEKARQEELSKAITGLFGGLAGAGVTVLGPVELGAASPDDDEPPAGKKH